MKKPLKIALFIAVLFVILILSAFILIEGNRPTSYLSTGGAQEAKMMSYGAEIPTPDTVQERMIIKTGSLSMIVEDVRSTIATIAKYAEESGGFVVSSNVNKYDLSISGDINIRIPSEIFEKSVSEVKGMGEVASESVYGEDVTEEYVDLEAQMKNLKATESQFLEIMKKAVKIEDVLAVQKELSNVRSEIERMEGRMKYLTQSVKLSTLTVYMSTNPSNLPVVDKDEWKPFAVIKNAARSLLYVGQGLVNGLIWFVIYTPLWILLGLGFWGGRKLWRKFW